MGRTPFDAKELLAAGFEEMRRTILEKEPLRPSMRLSALLAAEQTTAASFRRTEPPKLVHLVRGDLDWIVMKCLEKDRARRYETANALDEIEIAAPMQEDELLAVNEALDRFSQHAPQKAELVKLRYFAGFGLKEAGQVLGISEPTAVRWWTYSKTWLYQAIQQSRGPAKG